MNILRIIEKYIDCCNKIIGNSISWLTLIMVLVTVLVVVLRYGFSIGFIWMQDQ